MLPRTRLAFDLVRSFPRADNKPAKLLAYGAYGLAQFVDWPGLQRWRARNPLHAFILLTTRCNMSCDDCFFVDVINNKKVGRLDFDLKQIEANYESSLFRSVSRVILFGGEPTLNKHYIDIIRFFRSKGIVVTTTSNVLRLNRPLLEKLRDADLNLLNLTIYPVTERGQKFNLDKIEGVLKEAHTGAFDPERIVLSFHGVDIPSYERAYAFAVKNGARGLYFTRTFYTEYNPANGAHAEQEGFAREFEAMCAKMQAERKLNLYFVTQDKDPKSCPFIGNAFAYGPNETLSPCCQVTPADSFGRLSEPEPLMAFEETFIRGEVPAACKGCNLLGTSHF